MDNQMDKEMRRIILKAMVLKIIGEKPTHGYDIIKEVEKRTNGRWTPSPGSIYPALDGLESKGWIRCKEAERRKLYTITLKGKAALVRLKTKWLEHVREMTVFFETIIEENDPD
jgi:DNA-binding PadR family transcriptional regulator